MTQAGQVKGWTNYRWTVRVTQWQPRNYRSQGRQSTRWRDDIERFTRVEWSKLISGKESWLQMFVPIILQLIIPFTEENLHCFPFSIHENWLFNAFLSFKYIAFPCIFLRTIFHSFSLIMVNGLNTYMLRHLD